MSLLLDKKKKKNDKDPCKGLFFRGTVNIFATNEYVQEKRQVKLLKRMSCKGCDQCSYLMEMVQEDVSDGSFERYLHDIKDGKIYTIHISSYMDYESGYYEIDGISFIEHKE